MLVSILLCVYNGERYIESSVRSIMNQTYENVEILICDDGSTDQTSTIIKHLMEEDKRIKLFTKTNTGLTKSLNYLIDKAEGEWLARQDADDLSYSTRIEEQLRFSIENNIGFCTCKTERFNFEGSIDIRPKVPNKSLFNIDVLKFGNIHTHGTFFIQKKIMKKFMYDDTYTCGQDYNLLMRLISKNVKLGHLDKVLYKLRLHDDSVSKKNSKEQGVSIIRTLESLNIDSWYYKLQNNHLGRVIAFLIRYFVMKQS